MSAISRSAVGTTRIRQAPGTGRRIGRKLWSAAQLFHTAGWDREKRRLFTTVWPYTMVSAARLHNTHELARRTDRDGIPGAFVECGVWRGGCSAVLAHVAHTSPFDRKVWLFDSFAGLPEPTAADGPEAASYAANQTAGSLRSIGRCVARRADVEELLFHKVDVDPGQIEICAGWFQDTIPAARDRIGAIAVLRLDSDWYESEKLCLELLFDQVAPGGYVILDDYGFWTGSRRALHDFLERRQLNVPIVRVDEAGAYFRKADATPGARTK
jgi:hypothetical protein